MRRIGIGIVFAAVAALLLRPDAGVCADVATVDSIVAIVEDDAIFRSDVEQTVKQIMLQRGLTEIGATERAALEDQVLADLINSRLIVAKAGLMSIDVPFAEVEKHVERTIDENKQTLGGEEAFNQALQAEGLTLPELKRFIREQVRTRMLVDRVLGSEIDRGSLKISDDDIAALYEERKATLPLRPAVVHLQTIYISAESSQSANATARARADSLRGRLRAGEDFADVARKYSEDPSAKNGGSLGSVKLADLSEPKFAETAATLAVGEVSEPVLTTHGYHIIQVTGVDSTDQTVNVRHILIRVKPGDDDLEALFGEASAIRDSLVAGASFESMAVRHSDDEATAANGGDLGWLRVADLPEFFRDVLQEMRDGELSQVLREPGGFRLVRLIAREGERPYTFAEIEDDLRKLAEQDKVASAYDEYLANLRKEFYVDVRGE
jgi:peptidyl-prolyl cis-trans isomerase SurA